MIELYGHPFSAFTWKPLIAAYARGVTIDLRVVGPESPGNVEKLQELAPTGQMPALVDGAAEIVESNAIIEYLDRIGDAAPMIPREGAAALRSRMLADVFDDYVAAPMQKVVGDNARPDGSKDPMAADQARAELDRCYRWLERRLYGGWAAAADFSLADCAAAPALFYADWVHPIPKGVLRDYRARLLDHPAVVRVVDEARPFRHYFPLGAPDRD